MNSSNNKKTLLTNPRVIPRVFCAAMINPRGTPGMQIRNYQEKISEKSAEKKITKKIKKNHGIIFIYVENSIY